MLELYDKDRTGPLAVSVSTLQKMLPLGRTSIFGLIKSNRLTTVKVGRRRLILVSSVEALLRQDTEDQG
jgi:hypothetical protein